MRKKIFGSAIAVAVSVIGGWTVSRSTSDSTKYMIFIFIFALFTACRQENAVASDGTVEIQIRPDQSNQVDISQWIEDIELVPLETNDNSLIGLIHKIKTDANNLYVLEYNGNPVRIFSRNGKFISEAGHKGGGPGEYIQISDFLPDNDTVHVFAWSGNRKWIRYSGKNRFMYETDMSFPFNDICAIDGNRYLAYVSNGTVSKECSCYLYCMDDNLNILSRLDVKKPPGDIALYIPQNHLFQGAEGLLYKKDYGDTIYTVSRDLEIRPKYRLDFGKHWYSQAFLEKHYDKTVFEIYDGINQNNYAKWVNFWATDSHIIVGYAIQDDKKDCNHLAIYNKNTGATFNFKESPGNLPVNIIVHPYCVQGNRIISLISAEELLEIASKIDGSAAFAEKIKKCAAQIEETDNPVMVQYVFK
jgi:hypothetical protein